MFNYSLNFQLIHVQLCAITKPFVHLEEYSNEYEISAYIHLESGLQT